MGDSGIISRNSFFKLTAGVLLGFIAWMWYRISVFRMKNEQAVEFQHGQDIPLGISYYGKYYLFRTRDSLRAFSTTCTHAGCRISSSHSDILQCVCHGSQFEASTGMPLRGPAFKPLQELECRFNEEAGQWLVSFNLVKGEH